MPSLGAYVAPPELGSDFRRIFPASIISNLGDGAMAAAGPLLVASITTQPAAVGAAAFIQQLPWLLFACGSLGRPLLEMVVFMGPFSGRFRPCAPVIGGAGRNFRVDRSVLSMCSG